jgi:hypothetical protein
MLGSVPQVELIHSVFAGHPLVSSKKEVVMEAELPGRIHGQVDQILNSKNSEWVDILSVTIAVLHEQFTREQSHKAPFQDFGSLPYRKLTRIDKVEKNSA